MPFFAACMVRERAVPLPRGLIPIDRACANRYILPHAACDDAPMKGKSAP